MPLKASRRSANLLLGLWVAVACLGAVALLYWFPWRGPAAERARSRYETLRAMPREKALDAVRQAGTQETEEERNLREALLGPQSVEQRLDAMLVALRKEGRTFRRQPAWSPSGVKDELDSNMVLGAANSEGKRDVTFGFDFVAPERAWDRFLAEAATVETAAFLLLALPAFAIRRHAHKGSSERVVDDVADA